MDAWDFNSGCGWNEGEIKILLSVWNDCSFKDVWGARSLRVHMRMCTSNVFVAGEVCC